MQKQKKRSCSVALQYTFGQKAPIIIAKAKGALSKKLLEIAKKHHIPIENNELLVEVLSEQEIGACIPEESYTAVATIFAFLQDFGNTAH